MPFVPALVRDKSFQEWLHMLLVWCCAPDLESIALQALVHTGLTHQQQSTIERSRWGISCHLLSKFLNSFQRNTDMQIARAKTAVSIESEFRASWHEQQSEDTLDGNQIMMDSTEK